jgi:hypothetical protein
MSMTAIVSHSAKSSDETPKPRKKKPDPQTMSPPVKHGPRQYGAPSAVVAPAAKVAEKIKPPKKEKAKADPKLVSAARELRDRYLERVNDTPDALPAPIGRYDVTRALPALSAVEGPATATAPAMQIEAQPLRQLPDAA